MDMINLRGNKMTNLGLILMNLMFFSLTIILIALNFKVAAIIHFIISVCFLFKVLINCSNGNTELF